MSRTKRGVGTPYSEDEIRCAEALLALPDGTHDERTGRMFPPSGGNQEAFGILRHRRSTQRYQTEAFEESAAFYCRLVPSAEAAGVSQVHFILTDTQKNVLPPPGAFLRQMPEAVLLWRGRTSHLLFGVVFSRSLRASEEINSKIDRGDFGRNLGSISVAPNDVSIPVYFDYAGVWGTFACLGPLGPKPGSGYPRPFPTHQSIISRRIPPPDSPTINTLNRQIPSQPDRTSTLAASLIARSTRKRMSEWETALWFRGDLDRRIFPAMSRLRPFQGRRFSDLIIVQGRLRQEGHGQRLRAELTNDFHFCPFLFVDGKDRVMLASLDIIPPPPKLLREGDVGGVSFGDVIDTFFTTENPNEYAVLRVPLADLKFRFSHRYSGLVQFLPAR